MSRLTLNQLSQTYRKNRVYLNNKCICLFGHHQVNSTVNPFHCMSQGGEDTQLSDLTLYTLSVIPRPLLCQSFRVHCLFLQIACGGTKAVCRGSRLHQHMRSIRGPDLLSSVSSVLSSLSATTHGVFRRRSCDGQVRSRDRLASTLVYVNPEKSIWFAGGLTKSWALRAAETTLKQTRLLARMLIAFAQVSPNCIFSASTERLCFRSVYLISIIRDSRSRPSPASSSTASSRSKLISPLPL